MSESGDDGAACSEDGESQCSSAHSGDNGWDMAHGDDEALTETVLRKLSRYATTGRLPLATQDEKYSGQACAKQSNTVGAPSGLSVYPLQP